MPVASFAERDQGAAIGDELAQCIPTGSTDQRIRQATRAIGQFLKC